MSEMVEKVARAIADTQSFAWGLNYDTALEGDREHCREIARAAIQALMEPSERMKAIGNEALDEAKPADYIYRAMLTTALEEE